MFLKGENVARGFECDKEEFSRNWNRIFGERKPVRSGRYHYVNGVEVHEDDMPKTKTNHAPLCRIREESMDVEVHRASRDLRKKESELVRTEKGYRTLCK